MHGDSLLILKGTEVISLLEGRERELMDRVADAYKLHALGMDALPQSVFLRFPEDSARRIIALPAYLGGDFDVAGLKWISSFPDNVERGLDRASGVVVLNSMKTGWPEIILEGSVVNAKRTAASAALAAEHLMENCAVDCVALVGCGIINFEILRFLKVIWPGLDELILFDIHPERSAYFRQKCIETFTISKIHIAADIKALLASAPVISFATTATQPHISDVSQCRTGSAILHVSLRDFTPEVILSAMNIVDDVDHVCRVQTSLALAEKLTGNRQFIFATLGDILLQRKRLSGRNGAANLQIFSPFGLGILDLAVSSLVRDLAIQQSKGTIIPSFMPAPWVRVPAAAAIDACS